MMPKLMFWTWRNHYLIDDQGHVYMGTPLGLGFMNHVYKDSVYREREIVVWLVLFAFSLTWEHR